MLLGPMAHSLKERHRKDIKLVIDSVEENASNSNTPEVVAGGSGDRGQPWLHSEFKVNLGCISDCV